MSEPGSRYKRFRAILDIVSGFVLLCAAASLIWVNWPAKPARRALSVPTKPISLDGAAISGDPKAAVALVVFSEFKCPFCASFAHGALPQIRSNYLDTGAVKIAFRHFPLGAIHPFAPRAAEAALCAARQGEFDRFHDALFEDPKNLDEARVSTIVQDLRLDGGAFAQCLKEGLTRNQVALDISEGKAFGVSATPTFLFGRVLADGTVKVVSRFSGAKPFRAFEAEIEKALLTK